MKKDHLDVKQPAWRLSTTLTRLSKSLVQRPQPDTGKNPTGQNGPIKAQICGRIGDLYVSLHVSIVITIVIAAQKGIRITYEL